MKYGRKKKSKSATAENESRGSRLSPQAIIPADSLKSSDETNQRDSEPLDDEDFQLGEMDSSFLETLNDQSLVPVESTLQSDLFTNCNSTSEEALTAQSR
jgi:hypothetical protein